MKVIPELETDGKIFHDEETCDYFAYTQEQEVIEDPTESVPDYDFSGVSSDLPKDVDGETADEPSGMKDDL